MCVCIIDRARLLPWQVALAGSMLALVLQSMRPHHAVYIVIYISIYSPLSRCVYGGIECLGRASNMGQPQTCHS